MNFGTAIFNLKFIIFEVRKYFSYFKKTGKYF